MKRIKGMRSTSIIVLFFLIVIVLLGLGFVYTEWMKLHEAELPEKEAKAMQLSIVSIDKPSFNITIENTGTSSVRRSSVSVFTDNIARNCVWSGSGLIEPGETANCDLSGSCISGTVIRIDFPEGSDTQVC